MASALLKFNLLSLAIVLLFAPARPLCAQDTAVMEDFISKFRAAPDISFDFSMKKKSSLSASAVKLKGTLLYSHPGRACIELKGKDRTRICINENGIYVDSERSNVIQKYGMTSNANILYRVFETLKGGQNAFTLDAGGGKEATLGIDPGPADTFKKIFLKVDKKAFIIKNITVIYQKYSEEYTVSGMNFNAVAKKGAYEPAPGKKIIDFQEVKQ